MPDGSCLGISQTGDHAFLSGPELQLLFTSPDALPVSRQADLKSRNFLTSAGATAGTDRLIASRIAAKKSTIQQGPSLHAIVPTLQCAHSCKYCQVSRSLVGNGYSMSAENIDKVCTTIFESPSETLTIEFQGGDPLLRFDLIERAVLTIEALNKDHRRSIRFVVASTLHQVTEQMCEFFRAHQVILSTSIDGPAQLHNKNRPISTRDSYQRTVSAMELVRSVCGHDSVSALMTTTKESLGFPEAIVDEYVRLGLHDIFLRPLSTYGFAKRNQALLGYSLEDFLRFYWRAFDRILYWNKEGFELREVYASIILNKILSTFDGGYVDLQSPTGAGQSALVYNYDGFVYPSDEARMLAESGDTSLRLGRIGESLSTYRSSDVQASLIEASTVERMPGCNDCAYNLFCAPNPIDAQAQFGDRFAPPLLTEHCARHLQLFDSFYLRVRDADAWTLDLLYRWAAPKGLGAEQ